MPIASRALRIVCGTLLTAALLAPTATSADSNSAYQTLVSTYHDDYMALKGAGITDAQLKSFLSQLLAKLESTSNLGDANFDKVLISDAITISSSDPAFQTDLMSLFSVSDLADAAKGIVPSSLIPVRDVMKTEWMNSIGGGAGGAGGGDDQSSQPSDLYTVKDGTSGHSTIVIQDDSVMKAWAANDKLTSLSLQLKNSTTTYDLQLSSSLLAKGKELKKNLKITAENADMNIPFSELPDQGVTLQLTPVSASDVKGIAEKSHLQVVGLPISLQLMANGQNLPTWLLKGKQYAQSRISLPPGTDLQSLGAYIVDPKSDQVIPMPFTIETDTDGKKTVVVQHLGAGELFLGSRAVQFSDLHAHWSENSVQMLATRGVIAGYADGTFHPDQTVTRAEFAAMLTRALGMHLSGNSQFSDVTLTKWYSGAVAVASEAKLVSGDTDGRFRPDDVVTRQEAAVMLANAIKLLDDRIQNKTNLPFQNLPITDKSNIPGWAQPSVAQVISRQIMRGDEYKAFHPTDLTTRGQVAVMLSNLLYLSDLASK